ncbi:MAG: hypothetical protein WC438_05805 [Candidatus Pacearchaeota archaeon]|jgi:acetyl-CoA carboxylase alpha subunit
MKYKSKFLEIKKVNFDLDKFVAEIYKIRDKNGESSQPQIEIAKVFKFTKYQKLFELINEIQKISGRAPTYPLLLDYRDELTREMMNLIKKEYGEDIEFKIWEGLPLSLIIK